MKAMTFGTAAILVTLLATGVSWAGHPHERNGFFVGFNVGGGSAGVSIPDANTDRESGTDFNLRAGGAINDRVLLGGEIASWFKDENGTTVSFDTFAAAVTFFPGNVGFFLRGGIGFGTTSFTVDLGNGFTASKDETGLGLVAAAGYEWRLTQKFALGPQAEFAYLNIGGDLIDTANFFDFSLGFNWYW